MTTSDQEIASLDLGNSTCRMGLYGNGEIKRERFVSTKTFLSDPKSLTGSISCLACDDRLLLGVSSGRIGIEELGEDIGIKAFQPQCHDLR